MRLPIRQKSAARTKTRLAFAACVGLALAEHLAAQPSVLDSRIFSTGPSADEAAESPATYLRRARDTLVGVKDFTAALNPARQVLAAQGEARDETYALDLLALARIQAELGELEEAETRFLEGIDLLIAAEGEFSIRLVEPYQNLGRSYIKAARYPEAITALEQAQHVSQRNLGLFNVEQAGLLDDITTAYLGLGDTAEARRLQLERLENAVKRFGADDPRVFPFRYQLADYYQRSRMQISAREQYEQVLQSQETQLGSDHPALLSPLRQLVKVDLMTSQVEDDDAYARLVSILNTSAGVDAVERGLSLAVLGDWATVSGDPIGARNYYKQAWDALSSKPDVDASAFFAEPVMLDFMAPLSAVDRGARSRPYAWGSVVFEFDLSADGRPLNVQTIGTDAPLGPLATRYTRRLRETHFRPRLVAGEPVPLSGLQFTHYFRFYVNEDDEG
jgi:tetratricopeptide (TPR) repeat protein